MSCAHVEDVGAWVLGALPAGQAERFAAHLPGCAVCRREVAELQMVADTLPLVAEQVAPPPELKDRIMSVVRAEADVLGAAGPEADAIAAPAVAEEPARPARPAAARERPWWRRPLLTLRPDNPITQTGVLAEGKRHGVSSRLGRNRADVKHHWMDPFIVGAPWAGGIVVTYLLMRRMRRRP